MALEFTEPGDLPSPDDADHTPEKHKGPVTLRRTQVEQETTDQRLLDTRGPTDWVHTDPWRVLRIQSEFVEGFGALAELGRAVSADFAKKDRRVSWAAQRWVRGSAKFMISLW